MFADLVEGGTRITGAKTYFPEDRRYGALAREGKQSEASETSGPTLNQLACFNGDVQFAGDLLNGVKLT